MKKPNATDKITINIVEALDFYTSLLESALDEKEHGNEPMCNMFRDLAKEFYELCGLYEWDLTPRNKKDDATN